MTLGWLVIIACTLEVLFLVTASISPSVQAVWELHALSAVDTPQVLHFLVISWLNY